jgi:hypothetical protein
MPIKVEYTLKQNLCQSKVSRNMFFKGILGLKFVLRVQWNQKKCERLLNSENVLHRL